MKNDFYLENENEENTPPDSFRETKMNDVEINMAEENENNFKTVVETVDNNNNVINSQNTTNIAQNFQFQVYSQPNYYGYQPSYQPFFNQQFQNPEQTKLYFEKKAVKRTANFIGLGIILFFAFNFVISYILAFLMTKKEVVEFINNPAISLELNILITVLGFGLSSIFILKAQKVKASSIISYGPPKKGITLSAIMVAVGFCFVANIAVSLLQAKFQNVLPFASPDIEMPEGWLGFIISVLSVAVAPALIEEFLFRGVIMGSLLKFGKAFAIFTSALIFGLIHGNLVQIPFAFLVGLVIGTMVVETNSIWTGVIIHFINNSISVCFDYLSGFMDENILIILNLFLMSFLILIGIFGFYILSIKNKNLLSFDKTPHISTSIQKFGWFSASASIIVFFSITFLEILAVQIVV